MPDDDDDDVDYCPCCELCCRGEAERLKEELEIKLAHIEKRHNEH